MEVPELREGDVDVRTFQIQITKFMFDRTPTDLGK